MEGLMSEETIVRELHCRAMLGESIERIAAEFTDLLAESDGMGRVRLLAYFVVLFGDVPSHHPFVPSLN
jgi:hypothetical protein